MTWVRVARMRLGCYYRHLIEDWHKGNDGHHFITDFHRFLLAFRKSQPVSFPPHSLQLYERFLQSLQNNPKCVFRSLTEHVRGAPVDSQCVNVVLRHDLDAGKPEVARALCDVEKTLGLRSSVHILVDGLLYDPTLLVPLAQQLRDGGFDVGLHTQAWIHNDYISAFHLDINRFEEVFAFPPRTFTQHGAYPRTEGDALLRRIEFTRKIPELIADTSIIGYNNSFVWVSEDSNREGRPFPIDEHFFKVAEFSYLGGVSLVLTHDNHWRAS